MTHVQTSLIYAGPILMIVLVAVPAGIIADRIGIKKAAGIGVTIAAAGALLRGTAHSYPSLLVFTLIYGFGLGWSFPNLPKLVSAWTPRERAGLITGMFSGGLIAGSALAMAITVPLLLPLTHTFQGVFFIWSILPIIAAICWWLLVKEPPRPAGTRLQFAPVLRNKNLWLAAILLFLATFYIYTWSGWMPLLLTQRGASESLAGLLVSAGMWVGIPAVIILPRLSFKLGVRKPFLWVPGIILTLGALAAIYASVPANWALQVVVGAVASTRFAIVLALPIELMPQEQVGTASGLVLAIGYAGAISGPLIGGVILDFTGSLELSLLLLAASSVAATVIAVLIPETGVRAKK